MSRHHSVVGPAAIVFLAAGLTACGDADVAPQTAASPPAVAADKAVAPDVVQAVPDIKVGNSLPVAKALVRLHAHVAASMALARAGQAGMAAGHVKDALNDDHAADRRMLDDLGLDLSLLEKMAASDAEPATDELTWAQVDAHFDDLAYRAGGSPLVLAQYALTQMLSRYDAAVAADQPVDISGYQLAYGLATVATHRVSGIKGDAGDALRTELNALVALWPEDALPPQFAATTEQVRDQVDRIRDVLRYAR